MIARQRRRMRERAGALMTIDTRQTRIAGARVTLAPWAALLLTTLGVLVSTVTSTAAQALTRGPVLIETHHTDLAGNIRLSTNEAGDVIQRLDYAPFGEVDNRPCGPTNDPTPSPQFQGKLRDPKTCLDDFGARDYYMVTGRFQSVDPVLPIETALRDPQQWNRYAYARNNPLIYTDPDGRILLPLALAAVAVVTFHLVFDHEAVLNAPAPGDTTVAGPKIEAIALDAGSMALSRGTGGLSTAIGRAMGGRGSEAPNRKEAARSVDELSQAAAAADRGGLTAAGRALQKHGGREGSAFPAAKGNPLSVNQQGQHAVDNILTSPGSTTVTRNHARFGQVTEVRAPDGRGVRYGADGKFIGFLEPKK